jgi:protein FAM50
MITISLYNIGIGIFETTLSDTVTDNTYIMPPSEQQSGNSTPRFTSQTTSAEDLLKSQTVGLVHLSDFRKRRAEVLEQKEREAHDKSLGRFTSGNSRSATPSAGDVTDR